MYPRTSSERTRRPARLLAASVALVATAGVTACSDSAGSESAEVTTEDLQASRTT